MLHATIFFNSIIGFGFIVWSTVLFPALSSAEAPPPPPTATATPSECKIEEVFKGCSGDDLQRATLRIYESTISNFKPGQMGFGLENQIQHTCNFTVSPKHAVFEGVLEGRGESASAAKKALDERRSAVQDGLKVIQGELGGHEINRYREASSPHSYQVQGQKPAPSAFIARQRIQIRFNPKMDIDQALDHISTLGIEQFNPYWRPGYSSSTQSGEPLVTFDFGDTKNIYQDAEERCGEQAFLAWCKEKDKSAAQKTLLCDKGFNSAKENFGPRTLYLTSQPINQKNGGAYPITISISPGFTSPHQPTFNQITSDGPLNFSGSYSTNIIWDEP